MLIRKYKELHLFDNKIAVKLLNVHARDWNTWSGATRKLSFCQELSFYISRNTAYQRNVDRSLKGNFHY